MLFNSHHIIVRYAGQQEKWHDWDGKNNKKQ